MSEELEVKHYSCVSRRSISGQRGSTIARASSAVLQVSSIFREPLDAVKLAAL